MRKKETNPQHPDPEANPSNEPDAILKPATGRQIEGDMPTDLLKGEPPDPVADVPQPCAWDHAAGTGGDLTTWSYHTERGWLTAKRDAANLGADYTYTDAGRLETRQWARTISGSTRLTTTYGYHAGKLTSTTYNDGVTQNVGYSYDAFGRPHVVTQGGNSWAYTYDPATLQLDKEIVVYDTDFDGTGDFTRVLDRSQDNRLRPTGYQLKDATTVEARAAYTYDDAGRVRTVGDGGQDTFTYGYEPGHLLETVAGPVHTVTNTWDSTRNALLVKENKVGSTKISGYSYGVNAIGQRDSVARTTDVAGAFTTAWAYNTRGEVTGADHSDDAYDRFYQFDAIGNREQSRTGTATDSGGTLTNYTANGLNQYAAINSAVPTYDADGNQLTGLLPANPAMTVQYVWNGENRLIQSGGSGIPTATYRYDAFGRRICKNSTTNGARWFFYDGWNLIAEHRVGTNDLVLQRTHLWGKDLSGSLQGAGGVGGLLSTTVDETSFTGMFYPAYDGNGNITDYLNSSGGVQENFVYDAFGAVVGSSGINADFNFRFSTKYEDFETGLNYYGYRYYDPQQGRCISRDPLGEAVLTPEYNLYAFIRNDGINGYDLLGLLEGSEANEARRKAIDEAARGANGDKTYSKESKNGDFPSGTYKCNKFVADIIEKAGAKRPLNGKWPFRAGDWADPKVKIPEWRPLKPDEVPKPGDVAAYKIPGGGSDFSGHTGFITSEGNTSAHGDGGVFPQEGQFEKNPDSRYRRYTGE